MAEARDAEAEISHGIWRGPLHGIPIGVKDVFDVDGVATTAHSAMSRGTLADRDASAVRRLRDAGAVFLGKHGCWEFAIGGTSFDLPWPPPRNPWDTSRDTSGSSSGSAAAVAAGMALGAIGTDTGGSIRNPAAWCGVAGLKPTYGLVGVQGMLPLAPTLDHAGPIAWTSEDLALLMGVLAEGGPALPESRRPDFEQVVGSIAGWRIGVVRHFHQEERPADDETVRAFEATLLELEGAGATLREVRLPAFETFGAVSSLISRFESFQLHQKMLRADPDRYGRYAARRLTIGAFVRMEDYHHALSARGRLTAELSETMRDIDVIVLPMARWPARPIGEDSLTPDQQAFFSHPFNVTGSPALSVCNGYSAFGLPLSVQVVGRHFEDDRVLRVGDVVERAMGSRTRRPRLDVRIPQVPSGTGQEEAVEASAQFRDRMSSLGLRLPAGEDAKLEGAVMDLDRAAAALRSTPDGLG